MPRTCTVCRHPRRREIDAAIVSGLPYRGVAKQFTAGPDAVYRHREHVSTAILKIHAERDAEDARTLAQQLDDLHRRTLALLKAAEEAGDGRAALVAIREARSNLELMPDLQQTGADLTSSPEWIAIRGRLVDLVASYPELREAIGWAVSGAGRMPALCVQATA